MKYILVFRSVWHRNCVLYGQKNAIILYRIMAFDVLLVLKVVKGFIQKGIIARTFFE